MLSVHYESITLSSISNIGINEIRKREKMDDIELSPGYF